MPEDPRRPRAALPAHFGIATDYHDIWGARHAVAPTNLVALLAAFDVDATSDGAVAAAARAAEAAHVAGRRCRRCAAIDAGDRAASLPLRLPAAAGALRWTHRARKAARRTRRRRVDRDAAAASCAARPNSTACAARASAGSRPASPLPAGYHRLRIDGLDGETLLIAAPAALLAAGRAAGDGRVWGPAVQLYALRSDAQLGHRRLRRPGAAGRAGGRARRRHRRPQSAARPVPRTTRRTPAPTARRRGSSSNVLYIDVEAVDEFARLRRGAAAGALGRLPGAAGARCARRRAGRLPRRRRRQVRGAGAAVRPLPRARARRRQRARRRRFAPSSAAARTRAAARIALFEALQAHFHRADAVGLGLAGLARGLPRPGTARAVRAFAAAHAERDRVPRVPAVAGRARSSQRAGAHVPGARHGASACTSTWRCRSTGPAPTPGAHAAMLSRSAPASARRPTSSTRNGQGWGLPPLRPDRLRAERLPAPSSRRCAPTCARAGALRIDHVMGLMRLFWIPPGKTRARRRLRALPRCDELLAIVALESQRNRCMVIGEDLGTVRRRDARARWRARGVLSYRLLLLRARRRDGDFKPPARLPARRAGGGQHARPADARRLVGRAATCDLRLELGLFPDPQPSSRSSWSTARRSACACCWRCSAPACCRPTRSAEAAGAPDAAAETRGRGDPRLPRGARRRPVMMVQLEDVLGVVEQANMPGTTDAAPQLAAQARARPATQLAGDERIAQPVRAARGGCGRTRRGEAGGAARGLETRHPARHLPPAVPQGLRLRRRDRASCPTWRGSASATSTARRSSARGRAACTATTSSPTTRSTPSSAAPTASSASARRCARTAWASCSTWCPTTWACSAPTTPGGSTCSRTAPASLYAQPLRHRLAAARRRARTARCCCRCWATTTATCSTAASCVLAFEPESGSFGAALPRAPLPARAARPTRRCSARAERAGRRRTCAASSASIAAALRPRCLRARADAEATARRARARQGAAASAAWRGWSRAHAAVAQAHRARRCRRQRCRRAASALHALLEAQAYRLAYWRVAADEINYRRFFDVNDLAALRMERRAGVRGDAGPARSTSRRPASSTACASTTPTACTTRRSTSSACSRATPGAPGWCWPRCAGARPARPLYVVAEKIAAPRTRTCRESWPVHGTTGYRFADARQRPVRRHRRRGALRPRSGAASPDERSLRGAGLRRQARRHAQRAGVRADGAGERAAAHRARRPAHARLHPQRAAPRARRGRGLPAGLPHLHRRRRRRRRTGATSTGRSARRGGAAGAPTPSVFDFVRRSAARRRRPTARRRSCARARPRCAIRFQQFSAPVTAKGVEDTAFYRYLPPGLAQRGGRRSGPLRHDACAPSTAPARDRAARWPHTMLATSTHDNKRSEDVRSRIDVLSEMPAAWRLALRRWRAHEPRPPVASRRAARRRPRAADEYLLYQTLLGTLPAGGARRRGAAAAYRERIERYMLKAAREAKLRTSWTCPDEDYEAALAGFVGAPARPTRRPTRSSTTCRREAARLAWFGALQQPRRWRCSSSPRPACPTSTRATS